MNSLYRLAGMTAGHEKKDGNLPDRSDELTLLDVNLETKRLTLAKDLIDIVSHNFLRTSDCEVVHETGHQIRI